MSKEYTCEECGKNCQSDPQWTIWEERAPEQDERAAKLRRIDEFAKAALSGITSDLGDKVNHVRLAAWCYEMALDMEAARAAMIAKMEE